MTIKLTAGLIVVIASYSAVAKDNKLSEDPTKVVTQLGQVIPMKLKSVVH
ncbi:hypothetical protein [Pseudoalteromonas prydzensis]